MIFLAEVAVTLKPVVNDPQGLVVRDGLRQLGFSQVRSARVGKVIALELEADDEQSARDAVIRMTEQLLRNPVIEDYHVESVTQLAAQGGTLASGRTPAADAGVGGVPPNDVRQRMDQTVP